MAMNRMISGFYELQTAFQINYRYAKENGLAEDIHQLRTTIRRLKAMMAMIGVMLDDDQIKRNYIAQFSDLFKQAGKVREMQVNALIVKTNKAAYLQAFVNAQQRSKQRNMRQFLNAAELFDFHVLEAQNKQVLEKLEEFTDNQIVQKTEEYVIAKLNKVRRLQDQWHSNRILHKVRINLKAVNDILFLARKLPLNEELVELRKPVKKLHRALGDWHDLVVLDNSLKRFIERNKEVGKMGLINNFIDRKEIKCEEAKEKILSNLQGLMSNYSFSDQS